MTKIEVAEAIVKIRLGAKVTAVRSSSSGASHSFIYLDGTFLTCWAPIDNDLINYAECACPYRTITNVKVFEGIDSWVKRWFLPYLESMLAKE